MLTKTWVKNLGFLDDILEHFLGHFLGVNLECAIFQGTLNLIDLLLSDEFRGIFDRIDCLLEGRRL